MTDQATNEPEATEAKPLTVLPVNQVKFAEHVRHVFHVSVPADHIPLEMLEREYWKHHAANFRGGNKIEMLWEDRQGYAEAIVLDADSHGATIHFTVGPMRLGAVKKAKGKILYEAVWAGPHHRFKVVRKSDDEVMKQGFETKDEANRYIQQTLKAL